MQNESSNFFEENIGGHFSDPGVRSKFLNVTQNVLTIKNDKSFYLKNVLIKRKQKYTPKVS
jgi:hypothetical protein